MEISETSFIQNVRMPFQTMRWSAIFAGLVVGIATNLFLLLLGAAAGLLLFDGSQAQADRSVLVAAGIWNGLCMLIGAGVGGYVAARASGMRRTMDGVLHGTVAWGATLLLVTLLATTAAGATLGDVFSTGASGRTGGQGADSDRQAATQVLEQRLGLTSEQANLLVDQALAITGRTDSVSPEGRAQAQRGMQVASMAGAGLAVSVLLSLLAAIGGGMLGAHATRLGERSQRRAQRNEVPLAGVE